MNSIDHIYLRKCTKILTLILNSNIYQNIYYVSCTILDPVTGFKETIAAIKKVGTKGSIFGEITAGKKVPKEDMFGFLPETLERIGIPEGGSVNLPIIGKVSTRGFIGFLGEIALPSIPFAKSVKFAKAKKALQENNIKIIYAMKSIIIYIPSPLVYSLY